MKRGDFAFTEKKRVLADRLFGMVDDKAYEVIRKRFSLSGSYENRQKLSRIGEYFPRQDGGCGVKKQWVSQIEQRAIAHLRELFSRHFEGRLLEYFIGWESDESIIKKIGKEGISREEEELYNLLICGRAEHLPVNALMLPARAVNCLRKEGIRTAGELAGMEEKDLMSIRGFGKKCLKEVKERLDSLRLMLR